MVTKFTVLDDSVPRYTQAQLDAAVAAARAEVNRSAGRSLMGMFNGIGDMARKGAAPKPGSVENQMEESLVRLTERMAEVEKLYHAERAHNATLQAKLGEFSRRLAEIAAQMEDHKHGAH